MVSVENGHQVSQAGYHMYKLPFEDKMNEWTRLLLCCPVSWSVDKTVSQSGRLPHVQASIRRQDEWMNSPVIVLVSVLVYGQNSKPVRQATTGTYKLLLEDNMNEWTRLLLCWPVSWSVDKTVSQSDRLPYICISFCLKTRWTNNSPVIVLASVLVRGQDSKPVNHMYKLLFEDKMNEWTRLLLCWPVSWSVEWSSRKWVWSWSGPTIV